MRMVLGWVKRHWRALLPAALLVLGAGLTLAVTLTPLPAPYYPGTCRVYDRWGKLYTVLGTERFQPMPLEQAPTHFLQAVLSAEDDRFYRHPGFDLRGFLRAVWIDLKDGGMWQGGSTITMQVARNLYLSAERTIPRKVREIMYALKMERLYSKNEILEIYINRTYFGHGAYGLYAASDLYLGKRPADLTLAESAMLAGIIASPEHFTPYRHPDEALLRRALTLNRMVKLGYIDRQTAEKAKKDPLKLAGLKDLNRPAPYFVDYITQEIANRFTDGESWLRRGGLKIYTTIDPKMQSAAEKALKDGFSFPRWKDDGVSQPQGAMVAVDPLNGAIRAMVGGLSYKETQFNRVSSARRQPGSSFKPFVYGAALENGLTAASLLSAEKKSYPLGNGTYTPDDAKPDPRTAMTAREALSVSSNIVAVGLGYRLGADRIMAFAARLGISSHLEPNISLPLGTSEVSPLELAVAYAPFANGGLRVRSMAVTRIEDSDGRELIAQNPKHEAVLDPRIAFIITDMLRDVLRPGGTAARLNGRPGRPAAGKTGTTDNNRDAWFVGYTPDLIALVYMGNDRGAGGLPAGAGSLAAPIWASFMEKALDGTTVRDFPQPPGVVEREICAQTGFLATAGCEAQREFFVAGSEPATFCRVHREVRLRICTRSGLLATQQCRDTEIRAFGPDDIPTQYCDLCSPWRSFWKRLFGKPDDSGTENDGDKAGEGGNRAKPPKRRKFLFP